MVEWVFGVNFAAKWSVFLESDTYKLSGITFSGCLINSTCQSPCIWTSISGEAYRGAGFGFSVAALKKLLSWKTRACGTCHQPSLRILYEESIKNDDCRDSVLGWVLDEKEVKLVRMFPLLDPHALHHILPGDVHWCQPVISMHKTHLPDMGRLMKYDSQQT